MLFLQEKLILTKLRFRLNIPTPYVFMIRFLKAAQSEKKVHMMFWLFKYVFLRNCFVICLMFLFFFHVILAWTSCFLPDRIVSGGIWSIEVQVIITMCISNICCSVHLEYYPSLDRTSYETCSLRRTRTQAPI